MSFAPTDISGLKLWSDAPAITGKSDGDALSQWDDGSGAAHHLVQATGTKQPLYKTNILNGLPVVRFDGTDDFLKLAFTLNQPYTVFGVVKCRVGETEAGYLMDGNTNDSATLYQGNGGGNLKLYAGSGGPFITLGTSAFHLFTAVFNGASSEARLDGGSAATGNSGASNAGGVTLGSQASGGNNGDWDVAEFGVYDSVLSAVQLSWLQSYLARKYGLTSVLVPSLLMPRRAPRRHLINR